MTPAPSPVVRGAPGRGWYLVALAIFFAGFLAMGWVIYANVAGIGERLTRGVMPGTIEIQAAAPANYTIFHENPGLIDGAVYSGGIAGLRIEVQGPRGPVAVAPPTTSSRYSYSGRTGTAIFAFDAAEAGRYRIAGRYADGRSEPRSVIAVSAGFLGAIFTTIAIALLVALTASAVALTLGLSVFFRRRRAIASNN